MRAAPFSFTHQIYCHFNFTCKYIYVYKEVLSLRVWALARAQTYVSSHNTESFSKVSVMWNMYTCEHIYVYKEIPSVRTRKGTTICEFASHRFIYKSICDRTYVCLWVYACIQRESVSTRKGTNICEFAQHGFIYKTIHDTTNVY